MQLMNPLFVNPAIPRLHKLTHHRQSMVQPAPSLDNAAGPPPLGQGYVERSSLTTSWLFALCVKREILEKSRIQQCVEQSCFLGALLQNRVFQERVLLAVPQAWQKFAFGEAPRTLPWQASPQAAFCFAFASGVLLLWPLLVDAFLRRVNVHGVVHTWQRRPHMSTFF